MKAEYIQLNHCYISFVWLDMSENRIQNNRDLAIDAAQVGGVLLQILPPLVQAFTTALQGVVDRTLEETSALNDEHLKLTSQAKDIRRSLRAAVKDALQLLEKIDDFATIVLKRNNVAQIEQDVRNQNYSSLTELVRQISLCLNQLAEMHIAFKRNCDEAGGLCAAMVETCSSNAHKAKNQKKKTQIGGGVGSGVALATSVGVGVGGTVISIVAGVLTAGAGAAVGLPLTAAATAALAGPGIAGAVATAKSAKKYEKTASKFSQLSDSFTSMGDLSDELMEHIEDLNKALTNQQETSDEITRWLEHDEHAQTEAVCLALERLVELCCKTQDSTSPSREIVRNLQDRLKQLDL